MNYSIIIKIIGWVIQLEGIFFLPPALTGLLYREYKDALIYLLLGAVGLPVFSGYMAGISRFAAPGGGYLIGYLFLAGISSWFVQKYSAVSMQDQFFGAQPSSQSNSHIHT